MFSHEKSEATAAVTDAASASKALESQLMTEMYQVPGKGAREVCV